MGVEPTFLAYATLSHGFVDEVIARSVGVSYPAINASEIAKISISIPPLDEQRQIAEYLDRETGKIDELIAKQEQLVVCLSFG